MKKLPRKSLDRLRAAFASGRLPDEDDPAYDDILDIFGDLWEALGSAWANAKATQNQRHIAALIDLWSSVPGDGLVVGVAVNQPGVVPVAREAAAAMNLENVERYLAQIDSCIPPAVHQLDDVDDRLAWYQSKEGAPFAIRLDELDEEIQDGQFGPELMEGCFRRILAEPLDFFKS